ncbi:PAS domain S-box protein [Candidatus Villigracilis affinis]|uniref:PAS domain S-box protein n=1 Tax=Candidatus Villigracilis affinis TaxID=3140682 RepID=UPI001DEFBDC1|nr:PAS domain S-box protein [Anaerolineales bacterium]
MASKKTSLRSQNGFRNKVDEALQLALKFSPSPMWILDRESLAFLEINKAAQTQLGYGAAKLKGMTIVDVFSEDEKMRLFPNLKRVGRIGLFSGKWHILPKNGQFLSVTLTSRPLTYKGGKALLITASQLTPAEAVSPVEGNHDDEKCAILPSS